MPADTVLISSQLVQPNRGTVPVATIWSGVILETRLLPATSYGPFGEPIDTRRHRPPLRRGRPSYSSGAPSGPAISPGGCTADLSISVTACLAPLSRHSGWELRDQSQAIGRYSARRWQ